MRCWLFLKRAGSYVCSSASVSVTLSTMQLVENMASNLSLLAMAVPRQLIDLQHSPAANQDDAWIRQQMHYVQESLLCSQVPLEHNGNIITKTPPSHRLLEYEKRRHQSLVTIPMPSQHVSNAGHASLFVSASAFMSMAGLKSNTTFLQAMRSRTAW
jgi:hypothetical protein